MEESFITYDVAEVGDTLINGDYPRKPMQVILKTERRIQLFCDGPVVFHTYTPYQFDSAEFMRHKKNRWKIGGSDYAKARSK